MAGKYDSDPEPMIATSWDDRTFESDHTLAGGPVYGLELMLRTHSKHVKIRPDLLVIWMHWCLLRNGFNNHGGEFTHSDYHAEALPINLCWNGDKMAYILKYEFGGTPIVVGVYLDDAMETADISVVGLFRTLQLQFRIADLVDSSFQIREDVIDDLTKIVDEEFVRPMVPPKINAVERPKGFGNYSSINQ